jgi:hypothetical protein
MRMIGRRKHQAEDLAKEGSATAWATVLHARTRWTSGTNSENGPYTLGNNRHMTIELRVEPESEEPFVAKFRQTFPGKYPLEGFQAKVIYDPRDHSRIAILADLLHPAGVTHAQAERSAAHHAQVWKATEEGRLAEFYKEDIAARTGQDIRAIRRDES